MKKNIAMLAASSSYLYVALATGRVMGSMRTSAGANGQPEVSVTLPDGIIAVANATGASATGKRIQDVDGVTSEELAKVEKAMAEQLQATGEKRTTKAAEKAAAIALDPATPETEPAAS